MREAYGSSNGAGRVECQVRENGKPQLSPHSFFVAAVSLLPWCLCCLAAYGILRKMEGNHVMCPHSSSWMLSEDGIVQLHVVGLVGLYPAWIGED